MKNKLRILFLSSEVSPFAKTGGLADVSGALPKTLLEMGHDVRVIMPKYGMISERKFVLREVIRLKQIPVQLGSEVHVTCAKSAFIPDSKVQIYFLDYKPFFGRKDLYVDSKNGKDFPDNPERFALFNRAVIETIKLLHWQPQVIHCNDWPTALIPWYLKNEYKDDEFFKKTFTLLSVHNLAYQGVFDVKKAKDIGIADEFVQPGSDFEFYGKMNFLKAGLLNADKIHTVSPTYAKEIQTDSEISAGLQEVLEKRKDDIVGILNGVDESEWDPETDNVISSNYSAVDLEPKVENKKALLEKCGLTFNNDVPVIGIISRLADQKGWDIISDALKDILKLKVQLVVLGTGDPKYHKLLESWKEKYPDQLAVFIKFDNELAHLIEAGSDIFLMPSKYEPCGLNQMYSLLYGTVPVVRKTGGLADTVKDYTQDPDKGLGFVFEDYTGQALLKAVENAVTLYKDKAAWLKLMKRGMKSNFSWQNVAGQYVELYSKVDSSRK